MISPTQTEPTKSIEKDKNQEETKTDKGDAK